MKRIQAIIKRAGGVVSLAEMVGIPKDTVRSWAYRPAISPQEWVMDLIESEIERKAGLND